MLLKFPCLPDDFIRSVAVDATGHVTLGEHGDVNSGAPCRNLPQALPLIEDVVGARAADAVVSDPVGETSPFEAAIQQFVETIVDHEFYCVAYATKDQPHIEGLLHTLADGVRRLDVDIAACRARGEPLEAAVHARRLLHRLLSSTNRRMHKGYPEMLSYLLGKPLSYASHDFVSCSMSSLYSGLKINPRSAPILGSVAALSRSDKPRTNNYSATVADYAFRPVSLEGFPFYFFASGCDVVSEEPYLLWRDYPSATGGPVRRHPCYQQGRPIMSTRMLGTTLMDPESATERAEPLREYPYRLRLRVREAWRVPVMFGRMPTSPDKNSSIQAKGEYALFAMLLFRPWRGLTEIDFLASLLAHCTPESTSIEMWEVIYDAYQHWRAALDSVATPFLRRSAGAAPVPLRSEGSSDSGMPPFGTEQWWACVTSCKLRNLDLVLSGVKHNAYRQPTAVELLQYGVAPMQNDAQDDGIQDDGAGSEASDQNVKLPSDPGDDNCEAIMREDV